MTMWLCVSHERLKWKGLSLAVCASVFELCILAHRSLCCARTEMQVMFVNYSQLIATNVVVSQSFCYKIYIDLQWITASEIIDIFSLSLFATFFKMLEFRINSTLLMLTHWNYSVEYLIKTSCCQTIKCIRHPDYLLERFLFTFVNV